MPVLPKPVGHLNCSISVPTHNKPRQSSQPASSQSCLRRLTGSLQAGNKRQGSPVGATWKVRSRASSLPEGAMTLTCSNSMPWHGGEWGEEWVRFRLPHFCSRSALLITSSISDTLHTRLSFIPPLLAYCFVTHSLLIMTSANQSSQHHHKNDSKNASQLRTLCTMQPAKGELKLLASAMHAAAQYSGRTHDCQQVLAQYNPVSSSTDQGRSGLVFRVY